MKKRSFSVVEIKDKYVRSYLMKHYQGSQIYVRKIEREEIKSRKMAVGIFLQKGWSEHDICKMLHMYPSTYRKLATIQVSNWGGPRAGAGRSKEKRKYTKTAPSWAGKAHRNGTLALKTETPA